MTPFTHNVTAAAMGLAGAWFLRDHSAMVDGASMFAPWMPRSIPFGLGAMLGATAPDWLELAEFSTLFNRRVSLIPHRTLTHWPWPWLAVLALTVYLLPQYQDYPVREGIFTALGFVGAGLLHLLMDSLTPTGIPVGLSPFGPPTAIANIRTGSPAELLLTLSIWAIALGVIDLIRHTT